MFPALAINMILPAGKSSTARPPARMERARVMDADDHLVQAAGGGNAEAFAEIIARWKGRIFGMAAKYARNHHELEDLAQDITIRVWRGLNSWRGDAPFEHWLGRVAIRTCYDFLRRHRRRRENEISADTLPEHLGLDAQTPAEEAENHALILVRRAMQRLHPKEQLILTLLELEDKTVKEVAVLTGWSEGNVKVRAHRARASLRRVIEEIRTSA